MRPAAYILGNGPTLPIDVLSLLACSLTIGVNRILRSGFTPTAIVCADDDAINEIGETSAVVVGSSKSSRRNPDIMLEAVSGDQAWAAPALPGRLHINGSSGVAAARWALSLGCRPVYLLGMSATYLDGMTDFYGLNPAHSQTTLAGLASERDRLLTLPDVLDADGLNLARLSEADNYDQAELRAWLVESAR